MFDEKLNLLLESPDVYLIMDKVKSALIPESEKRKEFYKKIEENQKMEFINGEIYFQSPVRMSHNLVTGRLYMILNSFKMQCGGFVGIEKILISLTRNDYEPDLCYFSAEKSAQFTKEKMQFPAPDFVVEVLSPSTEKHDREIKKEDYAAHGIAEYWIIDPDREFIEQYVLTDKNDYELKTKVIDGTITCGVLANLQIPVRAIFDDEENRRFLKEKFS